MHVANSRLNFGTKYPENKILSHTASHHITTTNFTSAVFLQLQDSLLLNL